MYCCTAFTHALAPVRAGAITVHLVRFSKSMGIARTVRRNADTNVFSADMMISLCLGFIKLRLNSYSTN